MKRIILAAVLAVGCHERPEPLRKYTPCEIQWLSECIGITSRTRMYCEDFLKQRIEIGWVCKESPHAP